MNNLLRISMLKFITRGLNNSALRMGNWVSHLKYVLHCHLLIASTFKVAKGMKRVRLIGEKTISQGDWGLSILCLWWQGQIVIDNKGSLSEA